MAKAATTPTTMPAMAPPEIPLLFPELLLELRDAESLEEVDEDSATELEAEGVDDG